MGRFHLIVGGHKVAQKWENSRMGFRMEVAAVGMLELEARGLAEATDEGAPNGSAGVFNRLLYRVKRLAQFLPTSGAFGSRLPLIGRSTRVGCGGGTK